MNFLAKIVVPLLFLIGLSHAAVARSPEGLIKAVEIAVSEYSKNRVRVEVF